MFSFSEHIRELSIKFVCLLKLRLGKLNPTFIPLFLRFNALGGFFLTIGVPI